MHAVETKKLTKRYGKTYALKNLDFRIKNNEIMVLLGPNGSGKTTLLLILATVLKCARFPFTIIGALAYWSALLKLQVNGKL